MKWMGKIRPQVLLAIMSLTTVSCIALLKGGDGDLIAVATGCTGGIIALGMKLLEGE